MRSYLPFNEFHPTLENDTITSFDSVLIHLFIRDKERKEILCASFISHAWNNRSPLWSMSRSADHNTSSTFALPLGYREYTICCCRRIHVLTTIQLCACSAPYFHHVTNFTEQKQWWTPIRGSDEDWNIKQELNMDRSCWGWMGRKQMLRRSCCACDSGDVIAL